MLSKQIGGHATGLAILGAFSASAFTFSHLAYKHVERKEAPSDFPAAFSLGSKKDAACCTNDEKSFQAGLDKLCRLGERRDNFLQELTSVQANTSDLSQPHIRAAHEAQKREFYAAAKLLLVDAPVAGKQVSDDQFLSLFSAVRSALGKKDYCLVALEYEVGDSSAQRLGFRVFRVNGSGDESRCVWDERIKAPVLRLGEELTDFRGDPGGSPSLPRPLLALTTPDNKVVILEDRFRGTPATKGNASGAEADGVKVKGVLPLTIEGAVTHEFGHVYDKRHHPFAALMALSSRYRTVTSLEKFAYATEFRDGADLRQIMSELFRALKRHEKPECHNAALQELGRLLVAEMAKDPSRYGFKSGSTAADITANFKSARFSQKEKVRLANVMRRQLLDERAKIPQSWTEVLQLPLPAGTLLFFLAFNFGVVSSMGTYSSFRKLRDFLRVRRWIKGAFEDKGQSNAAAKKLRFTISGNRLKPEASMEGLKEIYRSELIRRLDGKSVAEQFDVLAPLLPEDDYDLDVFRAQVKLTVLAEPFALNDDSIKEGIDALYSNEEGEEKVDYKEIGHKLLSQLSLKRSELLQQENSCAAEVLYQEIEYCIVGVLKRLTELTKEDEAGWTWARCRQAVLGRLAPRR